VTTSDEPAAPDRDSGLVRIRLDLGYDGSAFSGWAAQPGRRTVQGVVQEALERITRTRPLILTVAGRTDAGVHASGQVAHADLPAAGWSDIQPTALRRLAGVLPADVRVHSIGRVSADFDARFSALWRRYVYRIDDAPSGVDALRSHVVLGWRRPLHVEDMASAAVALLGEHDFAAFCRPRPGATTVRSVQSLTVDRDAQGEIACTVQADAFCHSMVRSLVGALIAVGEGRRPTGWPAHLLARTVRANEVPVAPPHGLTLVAVGYPPPDQYGRQAAAARRRRLLTDDLGETVAQRHFRQDHQRGGAGE
jgi:tRNA pseudouridine38-40 synthase